MGDIGSDTESALYMMRDAYRELMHKDPKHELLKLAELHQDESGFNFSREYARRCVRDSDHYKVQGYTRYMLALEAAVNGDPVQLLDTNPPCEY